MKMGHVTTRAACNAKLVVWQRLKINLYPLLLVLVVLAFLVSVDAHAQQTMPSEYQVKAAYIYNFGKFVKWPTSSAAARTGAFTICVFAHDPFGIVLQSALGGESLNGKRVIIRYLLKPQESSGCHILFINSSDEHQLRDILAAAREASVLTVSDIHDFSKQGGMIQFVLAGDRVRFEINVANAESANLVLASDLLKVATAVRRSPESGG